MATLLRVGSRLHLRYQRPRFWTGCWGARRWGNRYWIRNVCRDFIAEDQIRARRIDILSPSQINISRSLGANLRDLIAEVIKILVDEPSNLRCFSGEPLGNLACFALLLAVDKFPANLFHRLIYKCVNTLDQLITWIQSHRT